MRQRRLAVVQPSRKSIPFPSAGHEGIFRAEGVHTFFCITQIGALTGSFLSTRLKWGKTRQKPSRLPSCPSQNKNKTPASDAASRLGGWGARREPAPRPVSPRRRLFSLARGGAGWGRRGAGGRDSAQLPLPGMTPGPPPRSRKHEQLRFSGCSPKLPLGMFLSFPRGHRRGKKIGKRKPPPTYHDFLRPFQRRVGALDLRGRAAQIRALEKGVGDPGGEDKTRGAPPSRPLGAAASRSADTGLRGARPGR